MKFNVFVDGSWLFKICGVSGPLYSRTDKRDKSFKLDFNKLIKLIQNKLRNDFQNPLIQSGDFYLFSAIFDYDENQIRKWYAEKKCDLKNQSIDKFIEQFKSNVNARTIFTKSAESSGFDISGVHTVPFKPWMCKKIIEKSYQEKMVDTSLVARLVEHTLIGSTETDIQVVIAGDLDILPGIKTVIPDYTKKLILVTVTPLQHDESTQVSSFELSNFNFEHEPILLDREVANIMQGTYVSQCNNPNCSKVFSSNFKITMNSSLCKKCQQERSR